MLEGCVPWPEEFKERYIRNGYWEQIPPGKAFDRLAEFFPDREALVFGDQRFTYYQLKNISDRLAVKFLEIGLRPLDRIVVQLPNVPEFVFAYFALLKIGVIPVLCLTAHRFNEITYIAEKAQAKGYIISDYYRNFSYLELAKEVRDTVSSIKYVFVVGEESRGNILISDLIIADSKQSLIEQVLDKYSPDPFEVAVLLLSGGTTGLPKLIARTHNDYLYTAKINALHAGLNKHSVYLAVAPLAHNMTLACPGITGTFLHGGKVILTSSTDTATICALTEKEKITNLPLVPAMVISLLNYEMVNDFNLSSLVAIISGGSKLNPEVAKRVKPELGCEIIQQFGMAEGMLAMTDIHDPEEMKYKTIGRPLSPADEIKIVDDKGIEVPVGEIGELWCRGPYTIRGYYQAPEHNAQAFSADGFYKTGDLVKLDPSCGGLSIQGRKKDLINRGGEKISAEGLENLILAHPKVHNAAVVAMPDPVLGEKVCAYIILYPKQVITLEELNNFLLGKKIAKFKLPERLEIMDQFPLTNVGKISKKDLRFDIQKKLESVAKN